MRTIGFGASQALLGTLERSDLTIDYVVDDFHRGQSFHGLRVCSPDELELEKKGDVFISVFAYSAKNIRAVFGRLHEMGFKYGDDYNDCSELHFSSVGKTLAEVFGVTPSADLFRQVKTLYLCTDIDNMSYIGGTWMLAELLKDLRVEGDVAECGVYKGGNAFTALMLTGVSRPYHLFDSFSGFPAMSVHDPSIRGDDFRDAVPAAVRFKTQFFPNAVVHQGVFRDTFSEVRMNRFALVYVDCDLYEPTKECCDFFYPRMTRGGVMLFHDYWIPEVADERAFQGVSRGLDEFLADKPERLIVFPETSHALFVKM